MDKFEQLKQKMLKKYERLPKMDATRCEKACLSGACKFECCTVSGCSPKEMRLINKYIKKNRLSLPLTQNMIGTGYIMPSVRENGEIIDDKGIVEFVKGTIKAPKCAYLGEKGCRIYEVRPAICRLFGAIKQMPCDKFPEEAESNMPASELLKNF